MSDPTTDLRHRPPYRQTYAAHAQPLIVTPTFVSRADVTPKAVRPVDPGFNVDARGRPTDTAPAVESDPNLAFDADYRTIEADEAALVDVPRSEFWTAVNDSVINRLYPEVATARA